MAHGTAHHLTGIDQRTHVGAIGFINRRRHRQEETGWLLRSVALPLNVPPAAAQFIAAHLARVVVAGFQRPNAGRIDVKSDHDAMFAEIHRHGRPS